MQENQSREDLINMLTDSYATSIEPDVGKDTSLANTLTSKLERLLWAQLSYFSPSQTEQPPQPQKEYESKEGPVLRDGNRYTTEQLREMSVIDFFYLHRKANLFNPSAIGAVTKYLNHLLHNRFSSGDAFEVADSENRYIGAYRNLYPKMKELIDYDTQEAINIIPNNRALRMSPSLVQRVNNFFVENYGISLGKN